VLAAEKSQKHAYRCNYLCNYLCGLLLVSISPNCQIESNPNFIFESQYFLPRTGSFVFTIFIVRKKIIRRFASDLRSL